VLYFCISINALARARASIPITTHVAVLNLLYNVKYLMSDPCRGEWEPDSDAVPKKDIEVAGGGTNLKRSCSTRGPVILLR
jgi:hypothetical protein